jgi:ATP-binding cassette subfamily B protein
LGERGVTLSGGQKQRLSIARAIAKSPKILILDDCLSAVDTKTEHQILNNLQEIMKGRTSVVISHRVSSAKLADKIIMLDGGHVIEQGTHEELMAKEGAYKELLRNNFKQKKLIRKLELTFIKFWSDDLALRYSAKTLCL